MEKLNFKNNETKLNKITMDTFQNNIKNAIDEIIETEAELLGSYFDVSTVFKKVIKHGKVVHVVFNGKTISAIPNNTAILAIGYESKLGSAECGKLGGISDNQYKVDTPLWAYVNNNTLLVPYIPSNKWVYFNFSFIIN